MPRCVHKTQEGRVCKNKCCNSLDVCNVHTKDCSVCLTKCTQGEVTTLNCGHMYHRECINTWFCGHNTCPMCRKVVKRSKIPIHVNYQTVDLETMMGDIRDMIYELYDSGNLPSGPISADYRNGIIIIVDIENNEVIAQFEQT